MILAVSGYRSVSLVAVLALAGCAGTNARSAPTAAPQKSYAQALAVCRRWHGGRPNQRWHLAPSESHVAACLRRFGWQADGAPTLESVAPAREPAT